MAANTTLENEPKKLKKQKLRNNEYYEIQSAYDKLYKKSKEGKVFYDLMKIISCENNILLAYRNIKNNKGSQTKGTDGQTIEHYKEWTQEKFVKYFQDKLINYHPKSVRRVEIPKKGQFDKLRPLGIPCMDDRIIQQCILQVLEPICEPKFHNHSYVFRPNRSASHAIARTQTLMNISKCHYVADIDIKGFFDNVNHGKLLKQMWSMGIRDKSLTGIIGRILKSEIKGVGKPNKGTPQGGIISPLLSNIVLNELDWWISGQWETFQTKYKYLWNGDKYSAVRKSKLKEIYIVGYADDFKILCKDYKTAQKIFIATKAWLNERLGLEINPDKSQITNVRKGKTEFLGFELFVRKKRSKFVSRSNISKKAKIEIKTKLKEQIKVIQRENKPYQANLLNSMILGMHQYYKIATLCSRDFANINFVVSKNLYNRLKGKTKKVKGRIKKPSTESRKSKTYLKFYGEYKQKPKIIAGVTMFPIYGCKFKIPQHFTQEISNYTEQGRKLIHNKLSGASSTILIQYLLKNKSGSVEYNDNRTSLMVAQNGKCGVTKEIFSIDNMECHHKKPKKFGGTDEYHNLMWVSKAVHKLIHATTPETIKKYLTILSLDKKMLEKVNSLRLAAENLEIRTVTI